MVQLLGGVTNVLPFNPYTSLQPQTCPGPTHLSNTQPSCLFDRYNCTFNTNTYPFFLFHSTLTFNTFHVLIGRCHRSGTLTVVTHLPTSRLLLGAPFRRHTPANFYSLCRTQFTQAVPMLVLWKFNPVLIGMVLSRHTLMVHYIIVIYDHAVFSCIPLYIPQATLSNIYIRRVMQSKSH